MHIFFSNVIKMAGLTKWRIFILSAFCMLVINVEKVSASQEIMKKLTQKFATVVEQCKSELKSPDHILQDFMNFWREEYELVNADMGCMIICMASKFDLLTDVGSMHHGKAQEFAMSHGADEELAKQLVAIIHGCEKQFEKESDDCTRVLEIAKCFRTKIHELKWAPSMETILEEVMSDM